MTDLTDRMRTCAAHLATASVVANPAAIDDAAALLLAAATEIELLTGPIDLGEPMEVIEPPPANFTIDHTPSAMWIGDDLKPIPNAPKNLNACPNCDSRANKTVRKKGKSLWLVCPVCDHAWTR